MNNLLVLLGFSVVLSLAGCKRSQPVPEAAGDSQKQTQASGKSATEPSSAPNSVVTAPLDYIQANVKARDHAKSQTALVSVQQAINAYEVAEGSRPKSLQELVNKGIIPSLPALPPGQKYNYNPSTGEVKIEGQ